MELFEAIKKRHSYRGEFLDTKIQKIDLERIVQAGVDAPSGCNAQTTSFIIIDDQEIVSKINKMHQSNKAMQTAVAYIAIVIDKEPKPVYSGFAFQIEDCSAATENMLLAITALGYATVWIDGWLRVEDNDLKVAELINLPNEKQVKILLPVGVPAQPITQGPKKAEFSERVVWNKY